MAASSEAALLKLSSGNCIPLFFLSYMQLSKNDGSGLGVAVRRTPVISMVCDGGDFAGGTKRT